MDKTQLSSNKSDSKDSAKSITRLRNLYSCFWVENTVTILWMLLCNFWNAELENWVKDNYLAGVSTGVISIILLSVAAFFSSSRKSPINLAVYTSFVITWMYTMGYISLLDESKNFVYVYSLIWGVSTGFLIECLMSQNIVNTLSAYMWIVFTTFIVFQGFIFYTDINLEWLAVWVAVV